MAVRSLLLILCVATSSCSGHQITAPLTRDEDVAEVASAVGDLHVSTIIGDSFNLWRIGWSTFAQIPLASVKPSKSFVRGDVQPYGGALCPPALSQQVRVCESWLGIHDFPLHSGSLDSSNPLCVVRDGGEPMFLQRDRVAEFVMPVRTVFLSMGGLPPMMVVGSTPRQVWQRHAQSLCLWSGKCRGPVGGWLGVADSEDTGEAFSGEPLEWVVDSSLCQTLFVDCPRWDVRYTLPGRFSVNVVPPPRSGACWPTLNACAWHNGVIRDAAGPGK